MPRKPPTYRPQAGRARTSTAHRDAARDREYDRRRGNAAARGYDRRWRKVRERKLNRDPLCEHCLARGLRTAASEVDHIVPIRDGGARYAMKNLCSICRRCHLLKHRRDAYRHTDRGPG